MSGELFQGFRTSGFFLKYFPNLNPTKSWCPKMKLECDLIVWIRTNLKLELIHMSVGLICEMDDFNIVGNILWPYKLMKMLYLSHNKRQKSFCHVWIKLITVYFQWAQKLWKNNARALQLWCLCTCIEISVHVHYIVTIHSQK